jgi:sarcosine oxidase / L-pipecolate oxidase
MMLNSDLSGEVLPPTKDKILKFTNATSFTSMVSTPSGHEISVPPSTEQSEVPQRLKDETKEIIRRIMPGMLDNGREPDWWRICWYVRRMAFV